MIVSMVLIAIFFRLFVSEGFTSMHYDFLEFMTIATKVVIVALTVWYSTKVGLSNGKAWLWGLSTLLPFMVVISFIYLLTRKNTSIVKDID